MIDFIPRKNALPKKDTFEHKNRSMLKIGTVSIWYQTTQKSDKKATQENIIQNLKQNFNYNLPYIYNVKLKKKQKIFKKTPEKTPNKMGTKKCRNIDWGDR